MKRKKTNLSELRVKSFVTEFTDKNEYTVKGGGISKAETAVGCPPLPTGPQDCPLHY